MPLFPGVFQAAAERVRIPPWTLLNDRPVSVPADFVGIHTHRWPVVAGQPDSGAPGFRFGCLRTHDSAFGRWSTIHTGPDQFDWSRPDAFMAGTSAPVVLTLFGTPAWAASAADRLHTGPYGGAGECGMPVDVAHAVTYVLAVLARYPGRICVVELWNEPAFKQDYTGFWWNSAAQLVELGTGVSAAVRKAGVPVASPGFAGRIDLGSNAHTWMAAGGAALCDEFAYHPYQTRLSADGLDIVTSPLYGRPALDPMLASVGFTGARSITEHGVDAAPSGALLQAFLVLPAPERFNYIAATLMAAAGMGLRRFCVYSYNSGLSGDLVGDTAGAIAAIDMVATKIAGQTISEARRMKDGSIVCMMSSGEIVGSRPSG